MRISVFTSVTDPRRRGDNYSDALSCYAELADELIIVNGGEEEDFEVHAHKTIMPALGIINSSWPQEFSWELIGQQFQKGYEAATGDWVIHADLDFLFHERDFDSIRKAFAVNGDAPALSFWKYQFILPDRYNLKSRLVIAVNKGKYGDRIRFDSGGDLCQPSVDGKEIKPNMVPEARIPFYNYEKPTKNISQIMDDTGRMARAWQRHFGEYKLGGPDDESAFNAWAEMMKGRFNKPLQKIKLEDHPMYVQNTLRSLNPSQFGYSGFGMLEVNQYA